MKKLFQLPFRRQLTVVLLLLSLLIALFTSIFSYQLAYRQFRDMSIQLTQNSISAVRSSVDDYFNTIQDYTTEILASSSLRTLSDLSIAEASLREEAFLSIVSTEVRFEIANANNADVIFSRIEFYLRNGCTFSTERDPYFSDYQTCLNTMEANGLNVNDHYVGTQWQVMPFSEKSSTDLVCVRYFYNNVMERVGIALFSIKPYTLDRLFQTLGDAQIINSKGIILAGQDSKLVGTKLVNPTLFEAIAAKPGGNTITYQEDGAEKLISYGPVGSTSVYLVVPNTTYEEMLSAKTEQYQRSVVQITAIAVLCAALIAAVISRNMGNNLKKLLDFIRQVDVSHNVELRYPADSNSEYDQLGTKINEMLDTIQTVTALREEDLQVNQTLELSLLRAQLNPHLLYNTLNSVLWNLENHQDQNATKLIASLSGYFQYALSKGNQIIPLADELMLIQHYLDLQRIARHKEFTLMLEIPEPYLATMLPKLTLQPIVENAILHGFDGYRDDGVITVSAQEETGKLILQVTDNGFGIMPDELESLNHSLHARMRPSDLHSFGLYGINRTLQQNYGPEYGLHITSEVDRFTCVSVTLPIDPGSERSEKECMM